MAEVKFNANLNYNVNYDINRAIEYANGIAAQEKSNENKRELWMSQMVDEMNNLGYNCACGVGLEFRNAAATFVNEVGGEIVRTAITPEDWADNLMVRATRFGYCNWVFGGLYWVRWHEGDVSHVKFHNHWNNETMGTPYEIRQVRRAPDFLCNLTWYV